MCVVLCSFLALVAFTANLFADEVHLRVNQIGYLPDDTKVAVAFSDEPIEGEFQLIDEATGQAVLAGPITPSPAPGWGRFAHHYHLDFSKAKAPGRHHLLVASSGERSQSFEIGPAAYADSVAQLLRFMRQQRCGYNPELDCVCHQRDGRTAFGPRPDGTFVDASGGWHDAGDQLKYLLTASYATGHMLLAYDVYPEKFDDRTDRLGHPEPNGLPDVLDEARWGLDWIFKLRPSPGEFYHQVADDRDHNGWKMPDEDTSDYGWGPNSYRVLYAAEGEPQGLREFKSESTGVANLTGRCAAAMAIAHRVWSERDPAFAQRCLASAKDFYALGKAREGVQQGNSYGAPYRYAETTWADDMEWAAAELFGETGEPGYLADAVRYADLAANDTWMPHETVGHYQYYPFINLGHYALYAHADEATRERLAGYYRAGLDATLARAGKNSYGAGAPFIWCSNNLVTSLAAQALLYERMTGDRRYRDHLLAQRDWLFGRNPWGTSMFTGLPLGGETPLDVHTSTWLLTHRDVSGGLIDGPVYAKIYDGLIGIHLNEPDEFSAFQTDHVVYHDDWGDYSTNEPTMDGTAGAVLMMAAFGAKPDESRAKTAERLTSPTADLPTDQGALRRGPRDKKRVALVFTADKHVDGAESIFQTLADREIAGAFFLTGAALEAEGMRDRVRRAVASGHYFGPHSHGHLLYAPWDDRSKSLVDKPRFQADLYRNLAELRELGAARREPVLFFPPYEWHNADHTAWARELGCLMVNFTTGGGTHRDFAPAGHAAHRPSRRLLADLLEHEAAEGLHGHLLLVHLGTAREDKFYTLLGELIDRLRERGYEFQRADDLLRVRQPPG